MKINDQTISQLTIPTPFPVGDVHVYLLKGDRLSLIDAGVKTKEAWEALNYQLKELGYAANDIEQIILTHHHPDHTGLIEQFPRVESIIGHKHAHVWLTRDELFFHNYEQFFRELYELYRVSKQFYPLLDKLDEPLFFAGKGELTDSLIENDTLPGHHEWKVIQTEGHAQSHLSFFNEKTGVFIAGDHLLYHISPNPLLEPSYVVNEERPKPLLQYLANLEKCLTLTIKQVLPGHGPIFSNVNEIIRKRLVEQEQRAAQVLKLLKKKSQTPFEICAQVFPNHYKKQFALTISETVGQLDFLEDKKLARQTIQDGALVYEPTLD